MGGIETPLTGPDLSLGIELAEVPDGGRLLGHAHGEPVLLVRPPGGDEVFAIGPTCTHYGGPLAEGLIAANEIRCPWHHACFDVRTGEAVAAPALANGVLLTARMGSARNGSAGFHQLDPGRTYYWSVQAVDSSFAGSPFAAEQQFDTGLRSINPVRHANGVFEFSFTATPGASFTAVAATNLSLGLTNWTVLGAITEISPGKFQFTDPDATNNPQRFYRVRSPRFQ
jgi:nitrite reductase/ring-hydroxylating ferredoxin subunit